MKKLPLKVMEPDIDDTNPWNPIADKLNRKDCADALSALIEGQEKPLTITLNGGMRSGSRDV